MEFIPQEAHLLLQLEKCEEVIVWSSDPFVNRQFQDFSKLIVISSDNKTEDENVLGQVYEFYEKDKEQFSYILVLFAIDDEINCLKLLTVCLGIFKNAYIYGNSATVSLIQEFAQDIDGMIECFQLDQDSYNALFNAPNQQDQHSLIHRNNFRRVYCSMQEYKGFYDVLTTNANIKDIYFDLQIKICSHLLDFRKDELKSRIKQAPLTKQQFQVQRNRILAEQFAEFHKENIEGNIQIIERFYKQMNEVKEYNTLLTNSKCSHLILKEFQFFENKKEQYQEYEEFEEDIDLFYQFYMENCPSYANKKLIILEFLTKVLKEGAKEFLEKIVQQSKYLPLPSQIANMNNVAIQEKEEYYENLMVQAQEQIEQLQKDIMNNRVNYEKNLEQLKEMTNLEIDELQEKIRLLETQTRKKDNVLRDSLNKYDKEKMLLEQKIHFQDLEIMEMKKKLKSHFSFNQFLNENKHTQTDESNQNGQSFLNSGDLTFKEEKIGTSKDNLDSNKLLNSQEFKSDAKLENEKLLQEIKQLTESISKKDAILKNLQYQNNSLQYEIENIKEQPQNSNNKSIGIQSIEQQQESLLLNYNATAGQKSQRSNLSGNEQMITPHKELQFTSGSDLRSKENKFASQNKREEYDTEDIHQIVDNLMDIDEDLRQIVENNEISAPQLSSSRNRQEREKQSSLKSTGNMSAPREKEAKLEQYIQELNQFIENLKREMQAQNEQIISQSEEISYLKEQLNNYELKQQEYEQLINNMSENEQNEQLLQDCHNLNELIQQKTDEQNQCLNLLQQQSYELEIKKKQINSYDIELQETSKRMQEQEERIKEKDEQLFQLFQLNQRYNNENILIQQELQQSMQERDELKNILDMCKNKIMQMEKLERQLTEQKQYIEQQDKAFYEQQEHFSTQVQQIQEEINARYSQELIDKEEQIMQLNTDLQQNLIMIQSLQNALMKYEGDKSQSFQHIKQKTNNNNYISSTHSSDSHINQNYQTQQNTSHGNNNINLKLSDFQNNSNLDQSRNSTRLSGYHQSQNQQQFNKQESKLKQSELHADDLRQATENQQNPQSSFRNEQEEALLIQSLFEGKNSANRKNQSLMKNSNLNNNDIAEEAEDVIEECDLVSHREVGAEKRSEKSFSSTSRFSNFHSDIQEIQSSNKIDQTINSKSNGRKDNNNDRLSLPARSSAHQHTSNHSDLDSDQIKHEFSIQKLCKENGRSHTEQSYSQLNQKGSMCYNQKELSFQDNHDDLFVNSNTFNNGINIYKQQGNSDRHRGSEKTLKGNQDIILLNNNINVNDKQPSTQNNKELLQDFLFSDCEAENEFKQSNININQMNNLTSLSKAQSQSSLLKQNNNSKRDLLGNIPADMQNSQLKLLKNVNSNSSSNSKRYQGSNNNTDMSQSSAFNIQQHDNSTPQHTLNNLNNEEKLQYKENIFNFIGQKSNFQTAPSQPTSTSKPYNNQAGQIVGQTHQVQSMNIKLENTFNRVSSQNALDLFQECDKVKQHQKSESFHPSPINPTNNNNIRKISKVNSVTPIINEFDLKVASSINEIPSPSYIQQHKQFLQPLIIHQQSQSEAIRQNNLNALNSSNSNHNLSNIQSQQNIFKLGTADLFEDIFPQSTNINTQGNRDKLCKENNSNQQLFRKISEKRKESNGLLQFENDLKVLEENILGASTSNANKNKFDINSIFNQKSENSNINNTSTSNHRKDTSSLGIFDQFNKKDLFGKGYLNSDSGITSVKNQERKNSKFISGTNYSINSNSVQPTQANSVTNKKSDNRFQFNIDNISSNSQNNSNLNTSRNVTPLNDRKNSFFQSVLSINDDKPSMQNSNNKSVNHVNSTYSPYSSVHSAFNKSIMTQPIGKDTSINNINNYSSNQTKSTTSNYLSVSPNTNKAQQSAKSFLKPNAVDSLSNNKKYQSSYISNLNLKI